MKHSIHGMGQMMSTMVLNRKQSIFGGAGAREAAGLVLEGQRGSKDSIDKMDLTVMDTKLKILEILQVTWPHSSLVCGSSELSFGLCSSPVHPQRATGLPPVLPPVCLQEGVCGRLSHGRRRRHHKRRARR